MPGASVDDILIGLKELEASLSRLLSGPQVGIRPDSVWVFYASSERLVAILKFRLGVERPGVREELPKSEHPETFLPVALREIRECLALLEKKDETGQIEALAALRKARTSLRAYLAAKRRLKTSPRRRTREAAKEAAASADSASKNDTVPSKGS